MEELIGALVHALIPDTESLKIDLDDSASDGLMIYRIFVDEKNMGRIIGKNGRIARAIRNIVKAAAMKKNMKIALEIG
ncbi:UPF0109 protein [Clostridia bacterium]|nr:UPF0109 protein [Clostridia bacterium]